MRLLPLYRICWRVRSTSSGCVPSTMRAPANRAMLRHRSCANHATNRPRSIAPTWWRCASRRATTSCST
uniref:Putative secreted protein n=1 Tax=Anopheles darlingi TaxID=43151 RepID=A0A2M4DPK7_ANODA